MLAHSFDSPEELVFDMLDKKYNGDAFCEYKYDGERI
jgi:ATP-dependent DNA ligase